MEKDRSSRLIAIIALCVAVVGLSIGFAAFTKELNITFSESNVNVSGELDIKFLASDDVNDTSTTINGFAFDYASKESLDLLVNPATISTDGTTISGFGATFNDKDQYFGYEFYIYNNSEYDAYLKAVDFLNYTGAETNKVCTALEGTTQSLVDTACEDIHIGIVVNGSDGSSISLFNTTEEGFTSIKISRGDIVDVCVAIGYAGDVYNNDLGISDSSALLPNGDFKIDIGAIKFSFSSLEG